MKPTAAITRTSHKHRISATLPAALLAGCAIATARESAQANPESSSPRPGSDLAALANLEDPAPAAGLTGDWGGARTSLAQRGINPYAVFSTEVFGNVDGGFKNGAVAAGVLDFGLELDLEKLVGWKGGGLTVSAFAAYGQDGSADYFGDFNVASNMFAATDINLFNLFLSQTFGDDRVTIKAGQLAVDEDFMAADTAGYFLNSAFGAVPIESGNTAAPIFPVAAPGVHVRINPTKSFSLHAGVYAGDAGPVESGNHGFDWRSGGAAGWVTFAEADYNYGSGVAKIGGYHHTGEFDNFRSGTVEDGLSAVYGIIDHRFIESDGGRPGLSAFARASIATPRERAVVDRYFDAGLALDNLFKENDALGFAVGHTIFGDDYLAANPGVSSSETTLELTYQIEVSEGWILQPDIQYIIDPHFSGDNALVFGLRTAISF